MMNTEEERVVLKAFLESNFDFDSLKEAGFFKGIKRNQYELQAQRICKFFSLNSVFDYIALPTGPCHIDYVASVFNCPVCGCKQQIMNNSNSMTGYVDCLGCKRLLHYACTMNDFIITEVGGFKEQTKTYLTEDERSSRIR
jgi:hypothetical protein